MRSGQALCGALFSGTVFLGCLHGAGVSRPPFPEDSQRREAIGSVHDLFSGFIERFGATNCHTLTGYDLSDASERRALIDEYKRLGPKHSCNHQIRFVVSHCHQRFLEWWHAENDGSLPQP